MKIILNACNIHSGGGAVILTDLISELLIEDCIFLYLDSRFSKVFNCISTMVVQNTLIGRLVAEYQMLKDSAEADLLLSVGNLPPLFKMRCKVAVIIQNRMLLDSSFFHMLNFRQRFGLFFQRIWLKLFFHNANQYIVQSITMAELFKKKFGNKIPVIVFQFMPVLPISCNCITEFDFFYPCSGSGHKNHINLFKAFILLSNEGIFPSLKLTINRTEHQHLCEMIDGLVSVHRLNIVNIGTIDRSLLCSYLKSSRALIFPSLIESFGLPLVEARVLNKPILAPELDYVRDVCVPLHTFDPNSPRSIARAIKRFLKIDERLVEIQTTHNLLKEIKSIPT